MVSQIIRGVHVFKANTWLQNTWKSVSTETMEQFFQNCGFDAGDKSILNEKTDTKFQELFAQVSSETRHNEYINFDAETITSEPAVDPTHIATQ